MNRTHKALKIGERREWEPYPGNKVVSISAIDKTRHDVGSFLSTFADLQRRFLNRSIIFIRLNHRVRMLRILCWPLIRIGMELKDMFPEYMKDNYFDNPSVHLLDRKIVQTWWNRVLERASEGAMETLTRPIIIMHGAAAIGANILLGKGCNKYAAPEFQ